MLYDRSYMRSQETSPIERTHAVTILLVATIGFFVLQKIITVSFPNADGERFLIDWFKLNSDNFRELKVWTVITYAFLHDSNSIWHIISNMLGLFFIGRAVEASIGKKQFFIVYFCSAVIGGLIYIFFHLDDSISVVGASAAVMGLLAFFCMSFPERPITFLLFFVIPFTVKPKWVFWAFLGISTYLLITSEMQGLNSVAHSAHLGGFLTGVIYYRYIYNRQTISGGILGQPSIELPKWFKRRKKTQKLSYQVNRSSQSQDELQKEINRILDKINASGFSSLENSEKETLNKAKEFLRR